VNHATCLRSFIDGSVYVKRQPCLIVNPLFFHLHISIFHLAFFMDLRKGYQHLVIFDGYTMKHILTSSSLFLFFCSLLLKRQSLLSCDFHTLENSFCQVLQLHLCQTNDIQPLYLYLHDLLTYGIFRLLLLIIC
jgi:hypothetical protein